MSLIPADVITDQDLLAVDNQAATEFGSSPLAEKRRVAVVQWMRPRVEAYGLPVNKHKTVRAPEAAWSLVGGAYVDRRDAFGARADADTNVAQILGSASTAIYLGMQQPFRGLQVDLSDTINANSLSLAVSYWSGAWSTPSSLVNGTAANTMVPLSQGGRITWAVPDDWMPRSINNSYAYWMRLTCSATLTNPTLVSQILPLAFTRLTFPTALYALGLLYREAIGTNRGGEEYARKAGMFMDAAEAELTLALSQLADEFDVDNSGAVEATEAQSLTPDWNSLSTWERG